ncbi:MAG: glycerophosphodiester phosphodiesterase [bacterium]|nr:glycerophosphodiester phosphodiesterase [bacterium]
MRTPWIRMVRHASAILALAALTACSTPETGRTHRRGSFVQGERPARSAGKIVIAHRGASGYLPEHTLEAYAMAYALGADYVEQDVVMTKDGRFVCLHDIHLEKVTNVEEAFPERKRDDGAWYAIDFTLEEIRGLRAHSRVRTRFPADMSAFRVPTFEEAIELIQGLNQSTGRRVGLYPELKQPGWHRKQGSPMEEGFLEILKRYGLNATDAPIFVQCFESGPLKRLRLDLESQAPQILLVGGKDPEIPLLQPDGLRGVAAYAEGIGPYKRLVETKPAIVKAAHDAGLAVHPYSFMAEIVPRQYASLAEELTHFYFVYDVDGVFSDFTDSAAQVLMDPGVPTK